MSGSGIVYSVGRVSDKDGAAVWRLWLANDDGNAAARAFLHNQRPHDPAPSVAVNIKRLPDPAPMEWAIAPIKAGEAIRWDAKHVYCGGARFDKVGFEYDPDAPLSPA